MRHATLEEPGELRKDLLRLLARRGDALGVGHALERRRVVADRIRGQRAARAGIGAGSGVSRSIGRSVVTCPLRPSLSQKRVRVCRNTFTVRE